MDLRQVHIPTYLPGLVEPETVADNEGPALFQRLRELTSKSVTSSSFEYPKVAFS